MSDTFRVLSLDGGGIKGTYAAAFLARLEEMSQKRVVEHFDLIAGTSTGGIIALALGLGIPASKILQFYVERGPEIFPLISVADRLVGRIRHAFRAKHGTSALRCALYEVFGDRVIGEALTRLVVPSYDGSSGDVYLFKTSHHPDFKRDYGERAVDVALATSAAPTFLRSFVGSSGTTLVDGGVWANCPAAVAVIEALTYLDQPYGSVDLLTIGTTEEPLHVPKSKAVGGLLQWVRFAPELMMQAQAKGALAHAKLLTGNRMLRITESVAPGRFNLDDPRSIGGLQALGEKAARHHEREVSRRFLASPIQPFVPFRGPRSVAPAQCG
jgi:patatin-like phospholipase/acyl hydrolase